MRKKGVLLLFNVIISYFKVKFELRAKTPNSDPIAGFVLSFCSDHSYLDMLDL
jgi:hypothetical protein